jgi:hypothetical protein
MVKIIFLKAITVFFLAVSMTSFCFAQTAIYTSSNSPVLGLKSFLPLTPSEIATKNQYWATTYPNAIQLASATNTYNCHGYARHMSSGGAEAVWIEGGDLVPPYGMPNNEDIYWTDGSYIEVCTPHRLSKVSYHISDHSAITTANANVFISKWGEGPLMQHAYNYAPNNSSLITQLFKYKPILS